MDVPQGINQMDNNVIEPSIKLTNPTNTNILVLNDDCLLVIFSSSSFTVMDLCSLAETCKRFKQLIVDRIFPKEFIVQGCGTGSESISTNYLESDETERILRNFGSCVSTLSISINNPVVLNWIAKYCAAGTLERLNVIETTVDERFAVTLKLIFQRLQALYIIKSPVECCENIFDACDPLTELEITSTTRCIAILANTFTNLERFVFGISQTFEKITGANDCIGRFADSDTLLEFIGRHKNLKILTLNTSYVYRSRNFAPTIGNNCKELEELTLRNFISSKIPSDFSQWQSLTKLRMLDVDIGFLNYKCLLSMLQALKSLEIVKLARMSLNPFKDHDVIPHLSQLPNLRELHLIRCSRSYNFPISATLTGLRQLHIIDFNQRFSTVGIVRQLAHLEELEIDKRNFALSEKSVSKILKIVEQRSNVLKLKCRFKLSENFWNNCNKNQKLKLIKLK